MKATKGCKDCYCAPCKCDAPDLTMHEHDQIQSRITGRMHEIKMGPHGTGEGAGGLVPKNPFASLAQAGYMHANPEVLGKKGLKEWDSATKGKKLPKRVSKK